MTAPTVSIAYVRLALRDVHAFRPIVESPLLDLTVLTDAMRLVRVADSPAARSSFLPRWLDEVVWEQLALARGQDVATTAPAVPTPEAAFKDAAADFAANHPDREAWSVLHLYFFSGRANTLRQLASMLPVGFNTLRRRLDRGYQLLADALNAKERDTLAATAHGRGLPRPLTRFIGREAELGSIRQLLATNRLVVLTGPGGIGKSRLAIRLAQDLAADYPDGAWFVEVAALSQPRQIAQALMTTFGLREVPGRTHADTLAEFVANKRLLLVVDNCEHLVEPCSALIQRLLQHSDALQVLATSREELHVAGAAHWPVPPMALPSNVPMITAANLIHFDAPRLFGARAAVAGHRFQVTDANAPQVSRICARLDGLPLAIELAAARLQHLTVDQLETRLADRFALLKDGRHASRRSHETLQAMMDWSYDLLSLPEQRLLQRLAVFRGGWTLEAAEAVCSGEGVEAEDVLELLTHLAAKSLVQVDVGEDGPRYGILETVREYALDRLEEGGDVGVWRDRHLDCVVDLALRAKPHLIGPEADVWLRQLDQERANIQVSLDWIVANGYGAQGSQLVEAMYKYWDIRGELTEGCELTTSVLECLEPASITEQRAQVLQVLGNLATLKGDFNDAMEHLNGALAIFRATNLSAGMARALNVLAIIADVHQNDLAKARECYEQALMICRQASDHSMESGVLSNYGTLVARSGDMAKAKRLSERAIELARMQGDLHGLAQRLSSRAIIHLTLGEYDEARPYIVEGLEIARRTNSRRTISHIVCEWGEVLLHDGEVQEAIKALDEGIRLFRESDSTRDLVFGLAAVGGARSLAGDLLGAREALVEGLMLSLEMEGREEPVAACLEMVAQLELVAGRWRRAARLSRIATTIRETFAIVQFAASRELAARVHTAAGEALGEAERDAAYAEGAALTTDQAIAYALEHATWEELAGADS